MYLHQMKVAIEYKALISLMVACGEAQGALLRAVQIGSSDTNYRNLSASAAAARKSMQEAIEGLNSSPIEAAPQSHFHSGPG